MAEKNRTDLDDSKQTRKGRPFKTLTEQEKDELADHYAHGCTQAQLCDISGVSEHVLRREMGERLAKAKAIMLTKVHKSAYMKAIEGDMQAIKYVLNCHSPGWTEKQSIDITSGGEPLQIVVTRRTRAQVEPDED